MQGKKRAPVTLIGGGRLTKDFGMSPFLRDALSHATPTTGKPVVVQIGAANGDHRIFGYATVRVLEKAGAEVVWPRLAGKRADPKAMRAALARADAVFVSGGDVAEGMRVLAEYDLVGAVRAAGDRGALFIGISAGSIMIGERWISWPHAKATDADASTFECLGIAPVSIDTHGEQDDWSELASFVTVRSRETKSAETAYGIPSGGCLVVRGDRVVAAGVAAQAFRARPGGVAVALEDIAIGDVL